MNENAKRKLSFLPPSKECDDLRWLLHTDLVSEGYVVDILKSQSADNSDYSEFLGDPEIAQMLDDLTYWVPRSDLEDRLGIKWSIINGLYGHTLEETKHWLHDHVWAPRKEQVKRMQISPDMVRASKEDIK